MERPAIKRASQGGSSITVTLAALTLGLGFYHGDLSGNPLESKGYSDDLPLCFEPGTTDAEIKAATKAAQLRSNLQGATSKARPVQRIACTATNPDCNSPYGRGITLTWSYLPDGTIIPPTSSASGSAPSNLFETLNFQFAGGFQEWHAIVSEAFAEWASVTGNKYVYEPNDDGSALFSSGGLLGVRGDVRIGMRPIPGTAAAFNMFPNSGSDMILDSTLIWGFPDSPFLKNVIMHEHGHGLGLAHVCPMDSTKVMEPVVNYLTHLGIDDILGGQTLYGDPLGQVDSYINAVKPSSARGTLLGVLPSGDDDWIEISGSGVVLVRVKPEGRTYLEAPQNANGSCPDGSETNSSSYSNLGLTAFRADGISQILATDIGLEGESERIRYQVPSGDQRSYVRVSAIGSRYQLYSLEGANLSSVMPVLTRLFDEPDLQIFSDDFE